MIESGAVGATFRIIDEASPALKVIAEQLAIIDKRAAEVKKSLASVGSTRFAGLTEKLAGVNAELSKMSDSVAGFGASFRSSLAGINEVSAASLAGLRAMSAEPRTLQSGAPPALRARGTGGGGHGGGPRFSGMGVPLPGGGGVHVGGNAALAAAGIIGYGAYEEAKMQDAIFQLLYHSGQAGTPSNRNRYRDIIQGSMSESGYSLDSITEAAKTEIRMFKGTPGNGIDVLPEMLRAATTEARLKGTSVEESMKSLVGLAHMMKDYDPESIKKLAPAFAFLSASNPSSLGAIERAAGYAVPILQSSMEMDPMSTLLLGTVLTRAGITSTKSGTWLRNMFANALPGTSTMSKTQFAKHEDALRSLGLIDGKGGATWFTDGKPDAFKLLDIASQNAALLDLVHRSAAEKALFGVQGEGAFSILSDPAIRQQVANLKAEMGSDSFKNRYAMFGQEYSANSPVQQFRQAWADLQNVLMDIGTAVLPPVVAGLRTFDDVLKGMQTHLGKGLTDTVIGGGLGLVVANWLKSRFGGLVTGGGGAAGAAGGGFFGWLASIVTLTAATDTAEGDAARALRDRLLRDDPNKNVSPMDLFRALGGGASSPVYGTWDRARRTLTDVYGGRPGLDAEMTREAVRAAALSSLPDIQTKIGDATKAGAQLGLAAGAAASQPAVRGAMQTGTSSGVLAGLRAASGAARGIVSSWFSGIAPLPSQPVHIHTAVNVDGKTLARSTSKYIVAGLTHQRMAPAADPGGYYSTADLQGATG